MLDHDHLSNQVIDQLTQLGAAADLSPHHLTQELTGLRAAASGAVSSFAGLEVTVVVKGHPITLVGFEPTTAPEMILTSIRIPLTPQPGDGSPPVQVSTAVRIYAHTPGAFVDLAADLTIALALNPPQTGRGHTGPVGEPVGESCIRLDADLPPTHTRTTVIGLDDYDTINQAVGILVAQGHHPDNAETKLAERAAFASTTTATQARHLVAQVSQGPPAH